MNDNEDIYDRDLKWIGVDFDNTIAHSSPPDFKIGTPLEGAIEAMQRLDARGFKITIFTARPWADYQKIENWCRRHAIPARRIICGKPLFKYLIDDRNIEFSGDWDAVLAKVKNDQDPQTSTPPVGGLDERPSPGNRPGYVELTIHDPADDNICDSCQ